LHMKTVRIFKLKDPGNEFASILNDLMRVFCSAKRYAFNRLLEGYKLNDLNKIIPAIFGLNKRYAEDAVLLANAVIDSQKELLPVRLEDIRSKITKTEKKIELYKTGKKKPQKCDLKTCLKGLTNRLEKLKTKEKELQKHLETGTIPKIIFGGKKNFIARRKGKITNEEWKDLRSQELYSRGDKSKKGNLNIRLVYENQKFYIEIADPLNMSESGRSPRIKAEAKVPEKFFTEVIDIILPDEGINSQGKPLETYKPYTVQIKRKKGEYYVHLIFEEEVHGEELKWNDKIDSDLIAGIDVNIDRIAVSILTKHGNFLKSKIFYCYEMEYVSANKRSNISGELAKDIVNYLLQENVGTIVLENIKLSQNHDTNRKFNMLTHTFAKNKMLSTITRKALRHGFMVKKVNPAYTSVIGRFKYSKKYGLSTHEAASFVIGRRGLGFTEKIPRELLEYLQNKVKPYLISILGSMEETEKKSNNGKKRLKYLMTLIKNIENFKKQHLWKIWNVVKKTLELKSYQLTLREV